MRRRSFLGLLLSTTSAWAGAVAVPGVPRPIGDPFSAVQYPPGAGATPSSVWSAADAAAGGMTLSNGGLTVTSSAAGAWHSIRSSIGKTSGKLYVEISTSTAVSDGDQMFGVGSSGFNPSDYFGDNPYSAGMQLQTNTYVSTGFTANYSSNLNYITSVNDVISLAIDFTAGSLWIGKNNVWSNSSNPATATAPIVSFVPATVGALFAGISFYGSNILTWTLQPTAASQKYAPPTGFTPWG